MTEIRWYEEGKPHMRIKENKGVTWLSYQAFEQFPDIVHAFSTRLGGVSQGIYSSMNLSFTRGDEDAAVHENYRRLAEAVGFSAEDIVTSDQTHTANVRVITEEDRENGITKPRPYTDVDGMVTNVPGLVLATFYADCVPLYFVDPVHRAIGLSHSGWRGTAAKIGKVTVEKMNEEYGTDPKDIYSAIGPSICQKCYEISEDVAKQFSEAYEADEIGQILQKGRVTGEGDQKYQLDLWAANWFQLKRAGVQPEHINLSGVCTCCNHELLFSHRASHGKRGNLNGFLRIRG